MKEKEIRLRKNNNKIKPEKNVAGRIRLTLIILLIILQLLFLVYLSISFTLIAKAFAIISLVLSVLTCVYILSTNKNGHSKAVWIMFILICFSFGYILFWLSSERIFLISTKKRYKAMYEKISTSSLEENQINFSSLSTKQNIDYLYSTGKFKAYTNTDCEYFSSGERYFDSVIKQMKKAKEFIFMEFFIISDGILLNQIMDILIEKVALGVEVRIIYDDLGCKKNFSNSAKLKLKKAGIKLKAFNKLLPIISATMNYRDHRKIIVIDGKFAFTGGCNLADEYINEKQMRSYWKDSGVKLNGAGVDGFTLMFLRQWEVLTKTKEDYSPFIELYKKGKSDSVVIPFADGLEYAHPIGRGVYENLITQANEYLYIMTPYFIIDDGIINLLINKALCGVKIKILLPQVPDKPLVYSLSRSYAEKLLDYGIQIYLVKGTFLHSKVMLNESSVVIGSINMDLRSFYQQFECAIFTDDKNILNSVKEDFTSAIENSIEVTQKNRWSNNLFYRLLVRAIQLFAPLM